MTWALDTMPMKVWITPLDKPPRPAEVLVRREGKLEWVVVMRIVMKSNS